MDHVYDIRDAVNVLHHILGNFYLWLGRVIAIEKSCMFNIFLTRPAVNIAFNKIDI